MIVSPDAAALIAACRSPPAGTTCVAAKVAEAEMNKTTRAAILGERLRRTAQVCGIDIMLRPKCTGIDRTDCKNQVVGMFRREGLTRSRRDYTSARFGKVVRLL